MGKIHISDDLKSKLNKVLSNRSPEDSINDSPVIPSPIWKNEVINEPVKEILQTEQSIKKITKYRKVEIDYLEFMKFIFITSFCTGIGLTFGFKIGKIIFY